MALPEYSMLPQVRGNAPREADDDASIFNFAVARVPPRPRPQQQRDAGGGDDRDVFDGAFEDAPAQPRRMGLRSQFD